MFLFRRLVIYFLLWTFMPISIAKVDNQTSGSNCRTNPAWTPKNRYAFIRRWREALHNLHLSGASQWPAVLKPCGKLLLPEPAEFKAAPQSGTEPPLASPPHPADPMLPPMDESVVNELSQPNMPTFQEFHAKVLGERRLDLADEASSVVIGQPLKTKSVSDSNLSHQSNSLDKEISSLPQSPTTTINASLPASSTLNNSNDPSKAFSISPADIILPTSVSENGGSSASRSKAGQELRVMRNIAASECGAKLLLASPAAKHAHAILVNNNDEYMNQPCASEKWFIIETCEPVQLGTIQIANYELFSSRSKTFRVFVSDRYPAKQWEQIGTFQAQDVKGLQTFTVPGSFTANGRLIKYVKFEMLNHYGNEHFCPITMVRLFGVSSDELDEPEPSPHAAAPPPPPTAAQSSTTTVTTMTNGAGEASMTLQEGKGETNVEDASATGKDSSFEKDSVEKRTTKSSKKGKRTKLKKQQHQKKASKSLLDPPVNGSSAVAESASDDCRDEDSPPLSSTDSIWQHATRFIMRVLQGAISSRGSDLHLLPSTTAPAASVCRHNSTNNNRHINQIISLLSTAAVTTTRASLSGRGADPLSLGLWHLGRCLQGDLPSAWEDCSTAEHLLNITDRSPRHASKPQLLRLADTYRKLTLDAARSKAARRRSVEALKSPSTVKREKAEEKELETFEAEEANHRGFQPPIDSSSIPTPDPALQPPPPVPNGSPATGNTGGNEITAETADLGTDASASSQEGATTDAPPSTSTTTTIGGGGGGGGGASSPVVEEIAAPSESEAKSSNFAEAEREVVLPAAMGGSWKETMYMRLNNKVLQLQSDVSVSMRYLEELSQSYKRQTERLSISFNITTAWLKATAKGAEERDLLQQERIDALETQLTKLIHILAEQGLIAVGNAAESGSFGLNQAASPVPAFQRPFPTALPSPMGSVNLQSLLWSVFFKSPAATGSSTFADSNISKLMAQSRSKSPTPPIVERKPKKTEEPSASGPQKREDVLSRRMSPQANLLFGAKKEREGEEEEKKAMWKFLLVVAARHLRNCVLSETFRLWMLHLVFAVCSQVIVYVIFLRALLRRCSNSISSPVSNVHPISSCDICSNTATFATSPPTLVVKSPNCTEHVDHDPVKSSNSTPPFKKGSSEEEEEEEAKVQTIRGFSQERPWEDPVEKVLVIHPNGALKDESEVAYQGGKPSTFPAKVEANVAEQEMATAKRGRRLRKKRRQLQKQQNDP